MIPNVAEAARSDITIAGLSFKVPAPFVEGHVLRENEAGALNQVYAENVRNNFASAVKAAKEAADKEGLAVDAQELQSQLDAYIAEYDFGVRRTGQKVSLDPVMREALVIARAKVRAALKKKGHKVADIPKDKIEELANQAITTYPIIREQAEKIVNAKKSAGLESLDIEA